MTSSWRSRRAPSGCARNSSIRTSENGPSASDLPAPADRSGKQRLRDPPLPAGCTQRVLQETGNRHRPDAAGNRGNGPCNPGAILEIAIAHQHRLVAALDSIDADIDDAGTGLDPAALDDFRPSDS